MRLKLPVFYLFIYFFFYLFFADIPHVEITGRVILVIFHAVSKPARHTRTMDRLMYLEISQCAAVGLAAPPSYDKLPTPNTVFYLNFKFVF